MEKKIELKTAKDLKYFIEEFLYEAYFELAGVEKDKAGSLVVQGVVAFIMSLLKRLSDFDCSEPSYYQLIKEDSAKLDSMITIANQKYTPGSKKWEAYVEALSDMKKYLTFYREKIMEELSDRIMTEQENQRAKKLYNEISKK